MQRSRTILIAGGGIAGLAAALTLARQGYRIAIFERDQSPQTIGAGLQLSPNATRSLERLGLLEEIEENAIQPDAVVLRRASNLQTLAEVPLGQTGRRRWGAPYLTIHRADLLASLRKAVEAEPEITLYGGVEIAGVERLETGAYLSLPGHPEADRHGLFLIGADGIHSATRSSLPKSRAPRFTNKVAWRTLITESDVDPELRELFARSVTAVVHPNFHLVVYPLGPRHGFNLVAVTSGEDSTGGWDRASERTELLSRLTRTDPRLTRLVERSDWTTWPLYQAGERGAWSDNRSLVLLGDAAHALTPFAAQGTAMAIEDAAVLARCLLTSGGEPGRALPQYVAERQPRIARVRRRGTFNHYAWHAGFPVDRVRDFVLGRRSGTALMADFDWLYGFDADV